MGSCWYLEHVTTHARIVLNRGENLMGRHSSCKITIKDYDFVSRVHVKMTVSDAGVLVQSMNTSNGVFINAQKMKDQISRIMVVEGAIISLGVEGDIKDVPRNYPIFVLRKVVTEAEEIVLSSDDDDDTRLLQDSKVGQMIPDLTAVKKDTTDQEENPFSSNLHLPKIPEVKQELVSKTTEEIRNIFGEADEAILGSVMDINPYLYNQLNKQSGNAASTSAKIYDGDVVELDADTDKEMQPPEQVEPVDEEYDEQFAISQAVLQGMKAEMAFSDGEEDFLSENVMKGEELMGSPSTQANYDDIIIIDESDDDELYNKVADWSNKLLSQRVPDAIEMSQTYPLMQDSGSDQESESRFAMKQPPKSLRIDSSSGDESSDLDLCNADTTTRLRPCRVRIESIHYVANVSELENRAPDSTTQSNKRAETQKFSSPVTSRDDNKEAFNDNVEAPKKLASQRLQNRSKSCCIERPIDIDKILENEDIQEKEGDTRSKQKSLEEVDDCREELVVTLHAPEKPEEIPVKKARGRPRSKTSGKVQAKNPQKGPKSVTQTKPGQDETAKVAETPVKRSARLSNRSRSCDMEPPIDMDESIRTMEDIKKKQSETRPRKRNQSIESDKYDVFFPLKELKAQCKKSEGNTSKIRINSHEEMEGKPSEHKYKRKSVTPRKNNTVDAVTPLKKGPSPRLLNREPQNGPRSVTPTKPDQDEPAKVAETPVNRSARLLNRSRSCLEQIDMDESIQTMEDIKEKQSETRPRKRNQSIENDYYDVFSPLKVLKTQCKKSEGITSKIRINSHEEMEGKTADHKYERKSVTPRKNNTVEAVIPLRKGPSPQLLNRSKSCCMDQPMNTDDSVKIPETEAISPAYTDSPMRAESAKEVRGNRGPPIIEAPFMTKNRVKFNNKDRQKTPDYQNPKNKQKDDQVNKDKRREALKKLSDKPKDEENSPFSSNANKRKTCTTVPTVSNTNRGEFLTKGIEGGPPAKTAKMAEKPKEPTPPAKNSIPKRHSTIDTCSEAEDDPAQYPQPHCSRPPERKEAHQARNQRTCNRVNFADMERYRQRAEEAKRMAKLRKHVRFCDEVNIKYIDKVCGANRPVRKSKDTLKICLSTHSERREWTLNGNHLVNDLLYHKRTILTWANQWLKHGSVDAVAESDVMVPIPSDFSGIQQYRKTYLPLIKLELLTTIERDYKSSKTTFDLKVMDVYCEKECYRIVGRTDVRPIGRFELYTLSSGTELAETFASLLVQKTVGGSVCDMTFEIGMQVSLEKMKSLSQLTARPVVDNLRMELGALSAIHQLHRSPLSRRILMPAEAVKTVQIPRTSQAFEYTGRTKLNRHQEDICLRVYKRVIDNGNPSVTLVQGPPGTGKSILLTNLSLQCLYGRASVMLDRKILICAHSNSAVDHMVTALSKALFAMSRDRFQLLRFGITEKMRESSRQFSIEAHTKAYTKAKIEKLKNLTRENIQTLEKQHCDLKAEIQQLKQMPNLMHKLEEKEKQLLLIREQLIPSLTQREEHEITKRCVHRAHIVCTTLSSCVKLANYVDFFDICIIDEATQCTEPWTLLPMRFGIKHLVLVGDTQQLPAVVLSKKAIEFGLGNSMFDRIQKSLVKHLDLDQAGGNHQFVHTKLFKLSLQYRMHPEICRWPNKYFYEDQLVNADLTAKSSPLIPYCVVNLSHTRDTIDTNGNRSISNEEEARFVAQLLTEMDKLMPIKQYSYGLISPYSNQCHALSRVIPPDMNLTPQTVDSYQGLEKDVIIISNARTRGCGFLSNYQRLNVALTRAKRCLIICGNFDDLQSVDLWRQLLDDARQRKVYFDLKRDDVTDLQRSLINKMLVKPIVIDP